MALDFEGVPFYRGKGRGLDFEVALASVFDVFVQELDVAEAMLDADVLQLDDDASVLAVAIALELDNLIGMKLSLR